MDSKELKTALKNAREAIKQKEYKEALKHCKTILKQDKSHYNALVFVGVAAEGLEQEDQALMAYTKASQADPAQPLAWQGLCSFYERVNKDDHLPALADVYCKLLTFQQGDVAKYQSTSIKLAKLYEKIQKYEQASEVYLGLLSKLPEEDTDTACDMWISVIKMPQQEPQMMKNGYQYLINHSKDTVVQDVWIEYIRWLLKQRPLDVAEIVAQCDRLSEKFPDAEFAVKTRAQIWLDTNAVSPLQADISGIMNLCDKLGESSAQGKSILAIIKMSQKAFTEAKQLALQGVRLDRRSIGSWLVYVQVSAVLHDNSAVDQGCKAVYQLVGLESPPQWLGVTMKEVEAVARRLHARSLLQDRRTDAAMQCIAWLMAEIDFEAKKDEGAWAAALNVECLLSAGRVEEAETALRESERVLADSQIQALNGWIAYNKGDFTAATEHLQRSIDQDGSQPYVLHWNALAHWKLAAKDTENHAPKALTGFLMAAKQDPYFADNFLYLGHYYLKFGKDKLKASKCLNKAFELSPGNEEIGTALVDLLTELGEKVHCMEILKKVTGAAVAGSCKWGWLRLGLVELSIGEDPTSAITALQSALRADMNDAHVWECLGEAYMTRGSHTAALKAFTRVTELNPDSLYSFYQLASIQQALGEYTAAVEGYEAVLLRSEDYVPALVGIGESLLLLARHACNQFFHGRALDYSTRAIKYLARCAVLRSDMSCIWKLLGDVLSIPHILPSQIARLSIPRILLTSSNQPSSAEGQEELLGKPELLALASRCYAMALKQQPNNSSLWQDLGMSYWREGCSAVLSSCLQCLHKAVSLEPSNHQHWLALATVAAQKQVDNKALAQHCYIKSIQLEPNNVEAWTGLGVLYMREGNIRGANEAFRSAQSVSPSHVGCWLGQAMLAETICHDVEAMDLFRHTTELDNHIEGSIGYGHWVVSILQDADKLQVDWNKYVIHKMAAIPSASDALCKYIDRVRDNPTAFCLYGLLLERQGLYNAAAQAFSEAMSLLDAATGQEEKKQKMTANYARILRLCGRYEESIAEYNKLVSMTFEDGCGMALTWYLQKDYDQAKQKYESLLESCVSEADKAELYTCLGMVTYCMGGVDTARTALFQNSQCPSPSRAGLVCLCALGLLQGDHTLATAALKELTPPPQPQQQKVDEEEEKAEEKKEEGEGEEDKRKEKEEDKDVTFVFLTALNRMAQGDLSGACKELQCGGGALWERLVAFVLGHCTRQIQELNIPMEASKGISCAMWSLAKGQHGSKRNAFREAQKAVLANPESLECWVCLLACGHAELIARGSQGRSCMMLAEHLLSTTSHIMARVEGDLRTASGEPFRQSWLQAVHVWCVRHYVVALLHAQRTQQAQHFLQQATWLYDTDAHLQSLLAFINQSPKSLHSVAGEDGHSWQMLLDLYTAQGMTGEVEKTIKEWIRIAGERNAGLTKLLQWAAANKQDEKWQSFLEDIKEGDEENGMLHLIRAMYALSQKNTRLARRHFALYLEIAPTEGELIYGRNLARTQLLAIHRDNKNAEAQEALLEQAKEEGDDNFIKMYARDA